MRSQVSKLRWVGWLALCFCSALQAVPREASRNDGAIVKLQAMVKSLTAERDAAQAETLQVIAELAALKKEHTEVAAAKEQLDGELSAQRSSNGEVRSRLDQTHAKLLEVIEKYKQLSQDKNELSGAFAKLKTEYETKEQQLTTCDEHNVKLYQSGQELLERYQNKGTFTGLLQDEPVLQFQSVEMENIVQEYEDKLRSGQYAKQVN